MSTIGRPRGGAVETVVIGEALDADPKIGVLLPCNVVVRETDTGVTVEALDPGLMSSLTGNAEMVQISDEARELVNDALARLQ